MNGLGSATAASEALRGRRRPLLVASWEWVARSASIARAGRSSAGRDDPVARREHRRRHRRSIADFPSRWRCTNPHAGSPATGFFCGGVILDATHVRDRRALPGRRTRAALSRRPKSRCSPGRPTSNATDPASVQGPGRGGRPPTPYNPAASDYDVGRANSSARRCGAVQRRRATAPSRSPRGARHRAGRSAHSRRAGAAASATQAATAPAQVLVSGWGDRQRPRRVARRATRAPANGAVPLVADSARAKKRMPRSNSRSRRG